MQLGARLEGCSARTEGVAQVVARSPRTTKPKADPAAEAELLATPAESPRKPAPKGGKVAAAIDKLLDSLFLDEAGEAKAAIARALASKLDQAASPTAPPPVAMSTAGIAKELRDVVESILEATGDDDDPQADMFAALGDPEDA